MKTLRNVPLILPLAGFISGLLLNFHGQSMESAYLVLILALIFVALHQQLGEWLPAKKWILREGSIFLLALAIGIFWKMDKVNPEAISPPLTEGHYYLAGCLAKPLKKTQYGSNSWLKVYAISQDGSGWNPWSGTVLCYFSKMDSLSSLLKFDTLFTRARVQRVRTKNAGYHDYLMQNEIHFQAQIQEYSYRGPGQSWEAALHQLQHKLGNDLDQLFANADLAGIGKAMFLGDKNDLNATLRDQFSVSGLSHVLAISGMHVGIVILILGLLRKVFPGASWGRKIADIWVLVMLVIYVGLAGAGPAVVRAGIMFGAVLLARMFYLRTDVRNIVFMAAFLQLLFDPELMYSAGFQLSYSAVIMLILFYPRFAEWVRTPWWLLNRCFDLLGVSLLATLATGPLVYFYFGSLPTYFLLSNLMVGPLLFVLVAGGFITVLICLIDPQLAIVPAWITEQFLYILHSSATWISNLPHASLQLDSWHNPALWILLAQLALAFLLFLFPKLIVFLSNHEKSFSWSFSQP